MQNKANFPYTVLPPNLQQVMLDVSNKTKAPPAMIFTSLMVATATATQNTHRIQRKKGLISNISIYTCCIAPSGSRKSTVENIVFKPLHEVQARLTAEHADTEQTYRFAYQRWALKGKFLEKIYMRSLRNGTEDAVALEALALHSKAMPEEPTCEKLFYADTTIEAWLAGLNQHSRSSTLLDDEGGRTLKGALMRSTGHLCALWDGKDIDVQRKHAGSFSVVNPRVSASIQIQPAIFHTLKDKASDARASGLWARFLLSEPLSTIGFRLEDDMPHSNDALEIFHQRLVDLYAQQENIMLRFTPEAQALWTYHFNEVEQSMAPGGYLEMFSDFGSKIAENTARLSALIHLTSDDGDQIPYATLQSAINVMSWFTNETINIFGGTGPQSQFMKDVAAFEAFMARAHAMGLHYVRTKNILQQGPYRLRKRVALNSVLLYLQSIGKCYWYFQGKTQFVSMLPSVAIG